MNAPWLHAATRGPRDAYLIATVSPEGEGYLPPSQRTRMGSTLVVGSFYRVSKDEDPVKWCIWLWTEAGGNMRMTQSCEAFDGVSPEALRDRMQKRVDKDGPWWGAVTQEAGEDRSKEEVA